MKNMHGVHISSIDLAQLRLLEAIARTGGLSSAAEAVGISQSAASHSLARLRRLLDDPLFVRSASGMKATAYGEHVATATATALRTLEDALRERPEFVPRESSRTFRIYLSEVGQLVLLPALMAYLRRQAPSVRLHVSGVPTVDPASGLESGAIDLAIGHITTMRAGIRRRRLFSEHYVCAAAIDNELFADGLSASAFSEAKHAVADSSGMAHWVGDKQLENYGIQRKVVLTVPEFVTLPFLLAGSDLLVTVPSRLADQFAKLVPLRIMPVPVSMAGYDVLLFWHERAHLDTANEWLRQLFVELFGTDAAHPRRDRGRRVAP